MTAVTELSNKQGYHPGPGGAFNYDAAGNMTGVGNKESTVMFNGLNLPQSATFTVGASMAWTYAADGRKLEHIGPDGTRQHADGIEVRDGKKFIYFPEGRAYLNDDQSAWVYEYALKDHLGNARVVIADINLNGTIDTHPDSLEILQENHYYPFGMNHEGEWIRQLDPINSYMYNGKEFTEDSLDIDGDGKLEMALDWYDYGARFYDPAIGRFTSVDPAADLRSWVSPYNYVQNNPINRIDPTGALDDPIHDSKTGEFLGHYNDSDFDGEIMLMDASTYQMITGGEDVVLSPEYAEQFGTYLQDYIGSNYKSDPAGGKELVSNVMTSLLTEASNAGIIDLDVGSLSQGKVNIQDAYGRIASSGPGYDGKWEVTGYVNTFSQNEEFTSDGTRSLWFLNNAGDAINILGVHEPLHQKYPGNHNHPIIDPLVLNPKSNPAINLASPQYIQHVQRRIARNKK